MNNGNVWNLPNSFLRGFTYCEGGYGTSPAHCTCGILKDGCNSVPLQLYWLRILYVKLCVIFTNMKIHDEI